MHKTKVVFYDEDYYFYVESAIFGVEVVIFIAKCFPFAIL